MSQTAAYHVLQRTDKLVKVERMKEIDKKRQEQRREK